MVFRVRNPFFFEVFNRLEKVINNESEELENLQNSDPVFYNISLFRAFLNYSERECEEMSINKYINSIIVLHEVLRLHHAPFLNK